MSTVQTTVDSNHIYTITLNRSATHNAFDDSMIAELLTELENINRDQQARFLFLQANGKHFCAGVDLHWMQKIATYSEQENIDDAKQLAALMQTLYQLSVPTICLVQGAAYGGGAGLVACCDIVIATSDAKFCFSEVKLGITPSVISPYVVAAIGVRQAKRYFISAEMISAEQALSIGLAHQVVSRGEVEQVKRDLAQQLLTNSPEAMRAIKQLTHSIHQQPIDQQLSEITAKHIATMRCSKHGQRGLQAFINKEKIAWD